MRDRVVRRGCVLSRSTREIVITVNPVAVATSSSLNARSDRQRMSSRDRSDAPLFPFFVFMGYMVYLVHGLVKSYFKIFNGVL